MNANNLFADPTATEIESFVSSDYGNGWRVKNLKSHSSGASVTDYEIRSTVLDGEMVGRLKISTLQQKRFMVSVNGMNLVVNTRNKLFSHFDK